MNEFINIISTLKHKARQTGRTIAMLESMRYIENAVFITMTASEAFQYEKEFKIKACSINNMKKLIGSNSVLFYDHFVIENMANELLKSHNKLNKIKLMLE